MGHKRPFKSKEDFTGKISKSVFVTNFLEHLTARDLWNVCTAYGKVSSPSETTPAIVMDDSCIDNKDLSCTLMGKIKDINALSNIYVILANEGFDNVNVTYLGGFWILIDACSVSSKEKMIKHILVEGLPPPSTLGITMPSRNCLPMGIKIIVKGRIYWIRVKELEARSPEFNNVFNENSSSDDESVEDGEIKSFQVDDVDHVSESSYMKKNNEHEIPNSVSKKGTVSDDPTDEEVNADVNKSHSNPHYNKNGVSSGKCGSNRSFNLNAGGSILDTMEDLIEIGNVTGYNMEGCSKNIEAIIGRQGDTSALLLSSLVEFFVSGIRTCSLRECVTISYSFVAVRGTWITSSTRLMFVSVYAPQDVFDRKTLWEYITHMINSWDGECVILGDFNEVRTESERFGTIFNDIGANAFNHFISSANLIDLPLEGYSYTWALKSASKMSKLDRFLIFEGLLSIYPSLAALCLDRHLFDHRPTLLCESIVDYGPTPFHRSPEKEVLSSEDDLDKLIDNGMSNDGIINERTSLLKDLLDLNKRHSLDMAQKAKIQWAIEGDENSKYFHGIINKKRSQLAIRGMLADGEWIEDPFKVKNEFLNHFSNRFSMPTGPNISFVSHMFKKISQDQNDDLESEVTYDEIKKAIWDCGTNKSPGPGGFIFDFIRKYWKVIQQDVVNAVKEFFSSCKFPPGSNSLFIALIPKLLEAKMMKDFRPISLIGSFYKIVAKILASRLSMVIHDLISEIQTAFIAKCQILDGPFIFNELISWCKYHKIKAMNFKSDFKKSFDSDKANVITIVNMLKCFYLASGLKINIHKSKIMGIGTSHEEVDSAARIIGCNTFSLPFNYLGVKVGSSSSRRKFWDEVIAKLLSRLSKWNLKTLSIGGRFTLTKSVLSSLPIYQMSLYKTPVGVFRKMESIRRRFFNGVDINENKMSITGWEKVMASRKKGGLGISSFFAQNRALLFKCIWRFRSKESSLWFRVIKAMFGDCGSLDKSGTISRSSTWINIIRECNLLSSKGINLLPHMKKKVRNGMNTLFWVDVWLTDTPLMHLYLRMFALECIKNSIVADKINANSISWSFRRPPHGGLEEEQFSNLIEDVKQVILWSLVSSGEFSVKSTRLFIDDCLLPTVGAPTRWLSEVPIKINILAWKVSLDKLPTRLNLSLRGIEIPSISCPICNYARESCSHLLFSCNMARDLIFKVARWWVLDLPVLFSYEDWLD
nr:RNA-directed DNA polymerase, eukaryota, reverse transcriptase zinc-binding domain protein [Tanacetum cinerariifolium]